MPKSSIAKNNKTPEQGNLRSLIQTSLYPEIGDRWALIVGISEYNHKRWNLQFAHRDASKLYELLQKPSAGGFAKERITFLRQ